MSEKHAHTENVHERGFKLLTKKIHIPSVFNAKVTSYTTRGLPFPDNSTGLATSNSVSGPRLVTMTLNGCNISSFKQEHKAIWFSMFIIFFPSSFGTNKFKLRIPSTLEDTLP